LSLVKEKSWAVKIVDGYVLDSQVRADHCRGCEAKTKLVVASNGNPDLLLYGCNSHKCKHVLIRMNFSESGQTAIMETDFAVSPTVVDLQGIHPNS